MKFLATLIINSLALYLTSLLLPGIHIQGFWTVVLAALVITLFNAVLRPLLLILTLPINILTLGLLTFFICGFTFWLAGAFVPDFKIDSIWWAILGSFLMGLINLLIRRVLY